MIPFSPICFPLSTCVPPPPPPPHFLENLCFLYPFELFCTMCFPKKLAMLRTIFYLTSLIFIQIFSIFHWQNHPSLCLSFPLLYQPLTLWHVSSADRALTENHIWRLVLLGSRNWGHDCPWLWGVLWWGLQADCVGVEVLQTRLHGLS